MIETTAQKEFVNSPKGILMATFTFANLKELGQWLKTQSEAAKRDALGTKPIKQKAFKEGQAYELGNLASLVEDGSIIIQEPEQKTIYVQNAAEEKKPERPSAANNDFLLWVKRNYSLKLYLIACKQFEEGHPEQDIRDYLAGAASLIK